MRKIVLILLAVFAVGALSAFNQGTINPGGYVAISSEKSDSDDDATTSIVVAPPNRLFRDRQLGSGFIAERWHGFTIE
mgnify:CR=1 FL=1|jgi:hypothetical protein